MQKKYLWILLPLIILLGVVFYWGGKIVEHHKGKTFLQGMIVLQATKTINDKELRIQPGTAVKLALTVQNKGKNPSKAGEVFIRYAFAKPLDKQPNSTLFQTEKAPLPSIAPGESITIDFKTEHRWPSLLDFVRDDWLMREYQAFVQTDKGEKMIGALAINVSAYYYPGFKNSFEAEVPSENDND